MTKTYAAKRLLEHGPLCFSDFLEITGWSSMQASSTLATLIKTGVAFFTVEGRKTFYQLW